MIEFLSAGSYPHAIMLLVRLFILLKLFLFARLRSTDDTMLLTEAAGWCRCGWWCRWGATERWQCMVTGRGGGTLATRPSLASSTGSSVPSPASPAPSHSHSLTPLSPYNIPPSTHHPAVNISPYISTHHPAVNTSPYISPYI